MDIIAKKSSVPLSPDDLPSSTPSSSYQRSNVIVSHNYFNNVASHSNTNTQNTHTEQITSEGQPRKKKEEKSIFICAQCNKSFRYKSYYEYHLRTHSGERPYQCEVCEKGFFEKSKLNRHLSSCHNVNNAYYKKELESLGNEGRNCPKCNKSFSRNSGLQAHLLTHEGARPFPCKTCGKAFSGRTALKNHELSHHKETQGILCDLCGKRFLLKKYLDLHLSTTHKQSKRSHVCPIPRCRKEFHSAKDLKRHQLMHSNERKFQCKVCKTTFKRNDNLNRHLKLTHSLNPEQNLSDDNDEVCAIEYERIEAPPPHPPPAPPVIRQVSVIRSTQEFIMSLSREQGQ